MQTSLAALDRNRLKGLRLLLLDVDGVLTTGNIIYHDEGGETKVFCVRDGLGIKLLMTAGIKVGVVTGRRSTSLARRCRELGIEAIYDGAADKAAVLDTILAETGVSSEETAFIGDDLPDWPIMRRVGLSIAVADAHLIIVERADAVTSLNGGHRGRSERSVKRF